MPNEFSQITETRDEFENSNEVEKKNLILTYFGLASYWAQCVEKTLENMLIAKELSSKSKLSNGIIDSVFDKVENSKSTMGMLISSVKSTFVIEESHLGQLRDVLKTRNYFAHKYFKVNSLKPYSERGQWEMILESVNFIEDCKSLDCELMKYEEVYESKMGLTKEMIHAEYEKAIKEQRIAENGK